MPSVLVPQCDLNGKSFEITLPASKSMANRAFVLAAQTVGEYELQGDFGSEDVQLMMRALKKLRIKIKEEDGGVRIMNDGSWVENDEDLELFLGNSGTCIRFLSSLVCLRRGKTVLTGIDRMKERPISDLGDALQMMGVKVNYLEKDGYPPIQIEVDEEPLSKVSIKGNTSSQYLTSLMLVGSSLENGIEITLESPLISKPYVEITKHMVEDWGGEVMFEGGIIAVDPADLIAEDRVVEGDASAAVYWWALAYLHGCKVSFSNLGEDTVQGDAGFEGFLNLLGTTPNPFIKVNNTMEIDFNDMPDASLMLMAMAPLLSHPIKITNIGSLRVKETDRIDAMATELKKLGVQVETGEDWISIQPLDMDSYDTEKVIQIDTYDDHRIAMSFAILGTRLGNLEILGSECVGKTYPGFWGHMMRICR